MLTMAIWVESFRCAGILLLQLQGENFAHRQHLKFCHFQPVPRASRSAISPKIFNQFSKSIFGDKGSLLAQCTGWKWQNFKCCRCAKFSPCHCKSKIPGQGENFAHRQHFKFCHFQPVHCASRNPLSPKVFNWFSKSLRQLEDVEGGHLGGKFQVRRYFTFAMVRWKLCASTTFEIMLLSTCTLCRKILYLQRYSGDFRNLGLISKMWTASIWLKSFRCARILLRQWQGENLCIEHFWNFATFNLYTAPAKIIYLQRFSTDFRNLPRSSTMLRVGICVESFRCAAVLLLQWQTENFAHRQHLKFCHNQPVHCASKNPISPKVFNRFSKSLPQLEDADGGHLGVKFQVRRCFTFAMAKWKLCASTAF